MPLQATGTVEVGNLPAFQQVAGTVDVGLKANFQAVDLLRRFLYTDFWNQASREKVNVRLIYDNAGRGGRLLW